MKLYICGRVQCQHHLECKRSQVHDHEGYIWNDCDGLWWRRPRSQDKKITYHACLEHCVEVKGDNLCG